MINWPASLVTEVARRRCILFLGAGVSATATDDQGGHPKTWVQFLEGACALTPAGGVQDAIRTLIGERRYLLALEAIAQEANRGDYNNFLDHNFNNARFHHSRLHEIVLALDSRVVITTNFDKIYERLCAATSREGFKVIPYTSDSLSDELRSDTRLIIKAHGTIDEIREMVFTKSEYHRAKEEYPQFYAMLRALFLTHTCIFVGCGLDDPDVLLLLEDVRITGSPQRPHYALVLRGEHSPYALRDWHRSYNVQALEYEPDHAALVPDLEALLEQVEEDRAIRQEP